MIKYKDLENKLLSDPEVKKEYDNMRFEYKVAETLIEARIKAKMTQADVARKMNTTQSAIARLESGNSFPTLQTIHKYASAINRSIDLHVIP